MYTVDHWIGGKRVGGETDHYAPVTDPATGEQTGRVELAGAGQVDLAVDAATSAAAEWGATSLATRTRVLFAYRQVLDEHRDELAALISAEHGKVHADALGEVARGIEVVEFACGIAQLPTSRIDFSTRSESSRTCLTCPIACWNS